MKKRMTLVVILNDDPTLGDEYALHPLASKSNEEWALEMAKTYGSDPSMELQTVIVEDME